MGAMHLIRRRVGRLALLAGLLAAAGRASADACAVDSWSTGDVPQKFLFPNWSKVEVASYTILLTLGQAGVEQVTGLTVVNFGTVPAADIAGVYWRGECGAIDTGYLPMTYKGTYTEDSGPYPAWVWTGTSLDFSTCADECGGTCGASYTIHLYADIAPCPTDGATLSLGFPIHALANPLNWGSISDSAGCVVPWYDMQGPNHTIVYAYKEGPDAAAPGDTVTYTITYGRPGTAALAAITVFDTQPPYTHYVVGSSTPAPDAGFDPDPGPPLRLKWTLPGGAVTGGPTGQLTFGVTVDWGNGEFFEPGSGDIAAPEGTRLDNRAHVTFNGIAGCGVPSVTTSPVTTTVRRFLFWKVGDNDVLFSQTFGQPPDEMIYTIYVQNMSAAKTWWNVSVWDTVPPELDPWCAGCGFNDPCTGWTMTPSGCAAATPGKVTGAGRTLLTWRLDMPPGMTLSLLWKSQVLPTVTAGATAINKASILEYGRTGIVGGTGASGTPRNFTHLARIILPTTYVSYVGQAASDYTCFGYHIDFFPLNKKTQFELRGIWYQGAGWSTAGGVSASIGCLIGDCLGGFPGAGGCTLGLGAISGGGIAGCKVERIPAQYLPAAPCSTYPMEHIYKVTSNSPVLWQLLAVETVNGDDNDTMTPSTTLTYVGMMHYAWKRYFDGTVRGNDALGIVSTGKDPYGAYNPALATTIHLFQFNYGTLQWDYKRTYDLAGESQVYDMGTPAAEAGPWRIMSSDTQIVINHGFNISNELGCFPGTCANDFGTYFPTRENGANVASTPTATYYGYVMGDMPGQLPNSTPVHCVVGNTGAATATYEVWQYVPDSSLPSLPVPILMVGTSGTWIHTATDTVPAGQGTAGNPRVYARDGGAFSAKSLALYKVNLLSGGPIQILGGAMMYAPHAGGAVMHSASGAQVGTQFWLHQTSSDDGGKGYNCGTGPGFTSIQTVSVFCAKQNMAVRATSQSGYSATYTTTGPDQCISFTAMTNMPNYNTNNYKFDVVAGGAVMTQFIQCKYSQKGYTAPFLLTGTHYAIIMPPVAFIGQSFWLTVVVVDATGNTAIDYCGTSSFTSTDPGAKIENTSMDTYNFTWSSATGGCPGANDNGVQVFVNVVFNRLGLQTIVAQDTTDGSISGIAAVMVVGADVRLTKQPPLLVAASGDTVRFQVCWSNYSSASAFTFTVTDAVPMGTTFLPEATTAPFDCGNTDGGAVTVSGSAATSTTPPPPASFATGNPGAGTRWLRWTVPLAGVQTTGCFCYRVTVN